MDILPGALAICRGKAVTVKEIAGNKITVNWDGSDKSVKARELIVIHPGPVTQIPAPAELSATPEEAAELMGDEGLDFADFAELLCGSFSGAAALAAYIEATEGVYFDLSGELIVSCKTPAERDALIAERRAKEEEKQRRAELVERVKSRNVLPDDRRYLREIEMVASGKSSSSKLLKELDIEAAPEKAHKLLLELGVWDVMHDPWPDRLDEDVSVPEFPAGEPEALPRTDLTHLASYAIDDAGSNDPDDALSFADGLLYVHIADPTALVEYDGKIDREASMRGESLYLPELLSPMLPEEIRLKCALGLEPENDALTFVLKISDDGNVTLEKLLLSRVKVTRLSYESCRKVADNRDFVQMTKALERFKNFRVANGAKLIKLPEVKVKVKDNAVEITPCPVTFERELVANAMLATGYATAKYMAEQDINFPFTVQAPPDEEFELNDTLSSMYEARKNSKAGVIEFKPGLHSGLGLEPYSRVTSPLRRYADLLAHRQLKSLILGREALGYEEMASKMTCAETAAASRRKLEKYANEYYTIVYLANHPGYTTTATLVAKRNGQLVFLIPELAYEYKARLQGNYQIDREYTLTLQLAEPSQQRCVFKVSNITQ